MHFVLGAMLVDMKPLNVLLIKLTNDIEGIYSTRKELVSVLNEISDKPKKKRFYGLLKKYSMLNGYNVFSSIFNISSVCK